MAEMSGADADLAYRFLNDRVRGDVETEAYAQTLEEWQENHPDEYGQLEAAHDDAESAFVWEQIEFEMEPEYDDLVPLTGVEPADEPEVREVAGDFAWDYLDAIRGEIRQLQAETDYSPRQFVALVLMADDSVDESYAASLMDISVGNYRGKTGDVKAKLATARETVRVSEQLGVE